MTFSIVGRCADTGQLGIAISSSSIAAICGSTRMSGATPRAWIERPDGV